MESIAEGGRAETPGTEGIWTFVFIDMIVFTLLFLVYLSEHLRLPAVFAAGQLHLNPVFGLVNTLILLTSSWCMVEAVHATRAGDRPRVSRQLMWTMISGAAFVVSKLIEYTSKIQLGITPATNSFYTFYFVITGLHFLHVIGGLSFIAHCRNRLGIEFAQPAYRKKVENVGLFWHFVDMLWLFIFPMLYLAGLQ